MHTWTQPRVAQRPQQPTARGGAMRGLRLLGRVGVTALAALTGLSSSALNAAEVTLPAYPFWTNPTFRVSQVTLDDAAGAYCAAEGPAADPLDFFYGTLALETMDALCQPALTNAERDKLLGSLYVSGYFGGIWLRDALQDTSPRTLEQLRRRMLRAQPLQASRPGGRYGSPSEFVVFQALASTVAGQRRAAEQGTDSDVIVENYQSIPDLLYLYGYNLGYIQVLYANPPTGIELPPDALVCGDYLLDCSSPDIDLDVLSAYAPALAKLQAPPSVAWETMAEQVVVYGESSVQSGIDTWESILADSTISSAAFLPLIDLSVGYLLVSDAAVLGAMTAWAEGQAAEGRCALQLQAGLTLWSGAYFMGLAADDPAGTAPTLSCSS